MRLWPLALIALAWTASAGCQSSRRAQATADLERENRELEDSLYQLKFQLDDCRRENQTLRAQANAAALANGPAVGPAFPGLPAHSLPATTVEPLPPAPRDPAQLQPPKVEGVPPQGAVSPAPATSLAPEARYPATSAVGTAPAPPTVIHARRTISHDSSRVRRLALQANATAGWDLDGRPGDDGVIVVIEPRDDQDKLVEAAAPITVVALDPALSGEAARVARWDFSLEQVAEAWQGSSASQGIVLELPWPGEAPEHGRLHLFVRFVTSDERRLEVDRQIDIRLPNQSTGRWAPSPSPTVASAAAAQSSSASRPAWSPYR